MRRQRLGQSRHDLAVLDERVWTGTRRRVDRPTVDQPGPPAAEPWSTTMIKRVTGPCKAFRAR